MLVCVSKASSNLLLFSCSQSPQDLFSFVAHPFFLHQFCFSENILLAHVTFLEMYKNVWVKRPQLDHLHICVCSLLYIWMLIVCFCLFPNKVPDDLTPEERQELENIRRRKQELLEDIQVISSDHFSEAAAFSASKVIWIHCSFEWVCSLNCLMSH